MADGALKAGHDNSADQDAIRAPHLPVQQATEASSQVHKPILDGDYVSRSNAQASHSRSKANYQYRTQGQN